MNSKQNSAIVMGGSMAGLLAARALVNHFETVTIVERDSGFSDTNSRRGVPQGSHFHALLAKGYEILREFFPGIETHLIEQGAVEVDVCLDFAWHHFGGWKLRFPTGVKGLFASRPFLESQVRNFLLKQSKVTFLSGLEVVKLVTSPDKKKIIGVEAVRAADGNVITTLNADLIVDATGRSSQLPKWLTECGYKKPPEEQVKVGVSYTTRVFERTAFPHVGKGVFITPTPPLTKGTGGLFPIEGDRWICTLGGWHGHHAPRTDEGFLAFARDLPSPEIYDVISKAKAVSEFAVFKYPVARRLRYEKLLAMPENIVPVGDSICSFNPIYGQGMTVCAIEASLLDLCLKTHIQKTGSFAGFESHFLKTISKQVVDVAWTLSTCEDLRYPETVGKRSLVTKLANVYVGRIHELAKSDADVLWKFYEVMNMLKPPEILFHPSIAAKVAFAKTT